MTFDDYTALFNQYKAAHPITQQATNYGGVQAEVSGYGGPQDAGSFANDEADRKLAEEWIQTLSPEQQADYARVTQEKDAKNHKEMPLWGLAALATVATLGALSPAIMGGTGGIFGGGAAAGGAAAAGGGAVPSALDVGMASLYGPGTAGMTAAEYAALSAGAGGSSILAGAVPAAGMDAAGNAIASTLPGTIASAAPGAVTPAVTQAATTGAGTGIVDKLIGGITSNPIQSLVGGAALASQLTNGFGADANTIPPPDPAKTIADQTAADKAAALFNLGTNRTNQVTPYGTSSWSLRPGADPNNPQPGDWIQTSAFSPEQQQIYDADIKAQQQQAALLQGLSARVGDATSQPWDISGAPALIGDVNSKITGIGDTIAGMDPMQYNQEAADAMYRQQTRYLTPEQETIKRSLEARLGEQGFVPGTPAYNQAMQTYMDTYDRALGGARDSSILTGTQVGQQGYTNQKSAYNDQIAAILAGQKAQNTGRTQYINESLAQRNQPLNEFNAVRTGTQVTAPSLGANYTSSINPVDTTAISGNNYAANVANNNANIAAGNNTTAGLTNLFAIMNNGNKSNLFSGMGG